MRAITRLIFTVAAVVASSAALAVPSLQLGDGGTGTWNYDAVSDTWVCTGSCGDVYATAQTTAWDDATDSGDTARYAYLVIAAVPQTEASDGDTFDVTVTGATLVESGFGSPPLISADDVAPHGIFDTYFEVYEFRFDGAATTICNTEPGSEADCTTGYEETIGVVLNSLSGSTTGIHFDLFTINQSGSRAGGFNDTDTMYDVAPFSHDAEYATGGPGEGPGGEDVPMPEPGSLALLGAGLLGLGMTRRRRKA